MKIGVIAGTPVDTRMGVEYIESHGHNAVSRASCKCPEEQARMQELFPKELTDQVISLCKEMINDGAEGIYINCNSMSTAIDVKRLRENLPDIKVVTPLDVYEECANNYKRLAIIAANGQSLAGIERTIAAKNHNVLTFGAGLMPLVIAIEKQKNPIEIMQDYRIAELINSFIAMNCDALILGCTHFPYIAEQIKNSCSIKMIDPNLRMLEMLINNNK